MDRIIELRAASQLALDRRHKRNLTAVAQTTEQRPSQEDAQPAVMRLQFVPEQPILPEPTTRVRK
jgi:hypothetical protein